MLTISDTELETFSFGNQDEDRYYILINIKQNPNGIDIQRLTASDPRTFDSVLNQMGCLLMLTGLEINELVNRGDIDSNSLHRSLFDLAKKEGIIP